MQLSILGITPADELILVLGGGLLIVGCWIELLGETFKFTTRFLFFSFGVALFALGLLGMISD